jgi:hypothetical protein
MRIVLKKYHYSNELASFMEDQVARDKIFPELWQETLKFLKEIKKDFPNFNESDPWPVELSDFVYWKKNGDLPEDDLF